MKLSKVLVVGILVSTMVIGKGAAVEAASQSEMVDMIGEEMTANYLYTELAKKYPEDKVFVNLAESEARHMEALKKSAARLGLSVEEARPADIKIPETKEEALAFALAFEQEDIDMLEKLIAKEEDARLKRVLNNLLKGSHSHYDTLKKAIDKGLDNLTCNEGRAYKNRADNQGQRGGRGQGGQGQGRGQSANGSQGQGQGQGQQGAQRGGNRGNS
ncbi:MAG: DUF2202 domain-containing protein [Fretibacterium sp.]|nr:DUF2202 domain-containing protein [Fretibacterium sp.]